VRVSRLIVVLNLWIAVASDASEPIKLYSGKAHAWAIKFSNDAETQLHNGAKRIQSKSGDFESAVH
jgi:hypothetical protein